MTSIVNTKTAYFIKFNPTINNIFGNRNASIVMDRLEYWFSKKKDGFYKFLEPCKIKPYRVGDSWEEETNLQRRSFKKTFQLLGTWYSSKSAYIKQNDPFKGKLYCAFYDRKQNKMFFLRNHELVQNFFDNLKNKVSDFVEENNKKCRSRNDTLCRSLTRVRIKDISQINTPSICKPDPKVELSNYQTKLSKIEIDGKLIEELKTVWLEEIGEFEDKGKTIYVGKQLVHAYQECFKEDLTEFRKFCRKVSSSKFLMGEVTAFKARADWLLKPETIEKIQGDIYSSGDRKPNHEHLERERRESFQTEEITDLKQDSTQDTELGMISKLKLFIINRFSYGVYVSWFRNCEISIKQNKLYITGETRFASDYIENHYLFDLEQWVSKKSDGAVI